MKRWEVSLSHISTVLVTVSGVAYLWMRYGMVNDDPFTVLNHPWQSAMLTLHLLSAPLLVFVVGLIAQSHIRKKLNGSNRFNRRSGLASAVTLPVMIFSGYGLQVVANPALIRVVLILHLASSFVFVLSYLAHQIISFSRVRSSATEPDSTAIPRGSTA